MTTRRARFATMLLGLGALACGHKGPPLPPPLMHPAPARDLSVAQRGDELILTFTYPQTAISGLPLERIEKVEYWELVKPVPSSSLDAETEEGEEGLGEDEPEGEQADTGEETGTAEEPEPAEDAEGEEPDPAIDETEEADDEDAEGEEPDPAAAEAEEADDEDAEADEDAEDLLAQDPFAPLPPPPTLEQMAAVEYIEFSATAQLRLAIEADELEAATVGDKIVLRMPFPKAEEEVDTAYVYSVKTFSDDRRISALSNLAILVRREPPVAPEEFKVEAEAGGVRVSWKNDKAELVREAIADAVAAGDPPPTPSQVLATMEEEAAAAANTAGEDETEPSVLKVESYRIYRRDAQARNYPPYVGQVDPGSDEYLDRTAQYGNRYIYAVAAVGRYSPLIESPLAGEQEIDFQDRFAPPAPKNPIALAEPGRVRILWDASPAPDLDGYIVFRRRPGQEDFVRLNVKPLVDLEYNDRDVSAGTDYEYRVAAVDQVGNQGEPSLTVGARTP